MILFLLVCRVCANVSTDDQRPMTTTHQHGRRRRQKWPPSAASEIQNLRIGSIRYDGPIKQTCILSARRWYKSQKHSDGKARFIAIFAALPEHFKGFSLAHCWQKACSLDQGIVPHLSNAFQVEFLAFYVVLGGHFWRWRLWWWCWLFSYYRSEKVLNPP